jgi:serine/threonine protein kinase
MFSTLVRHSDGMFTRQSASTNLSNSDTENDLIAFLSIIQKYNIDFLPITWQPTLSDLGRGASGTVSQSTFYADKPLAFKRYQHNDGSEMDFLPIMSEVLILSQPPVQHHPNIVKLEGICWEIKRRTEKAVPVLVFQKATWDLKQFMNVREGMDMTVDERLQICANVGSAIMALHAYGKFFETDITLESNTSSDVIHGDIKPQNVLVFKDVSGKTTVKVADFGYSTVTAGGEGSVFLPKSRPWNAPEHHFEKFVASEAKKTDVYSFGMLCLWTLFGKMRIPGDNTEYTFGTSTGPHTSLEKLKYDDKIVHIAKQLIESVLPADFDEQRRIHLKEFFSLTIFLEPEKRTSDLKRLINLLSYER